MLQLNLVAPNIIRKNKNAEKIAYLKELLNKDSRKYIQ